MSTIYFVSMMIYWITTIRFSTYTLIIFFSFFIYCSIAKIRNNKLILVQVFQCLFPFSVDLMAHLYAKNDICVTLKEIDMKKILLILLCAVAANGLRRVPSCDVYTTAQSILTHLLVLTVWSLSEPGRGNMCVWVYWTQIRLLLELKKSSLWNYCYNKKIFSVILEDFNYFSLIIIVIIIKLNLFRQIKEKNWRSLGKNSKKNWFFFLF